MKKTIITILCFWSLASFAEVTVTNVVAAQIPGTKTVEVSYDVSSTQNKVAVSLQVKNGAAEISAPSLTGDIGTNVTSGAGKKIIWDMGNDWNGNTGTEIAFFVTAEDVIPLGGDLSATSWVEVNDRWVKNIYEDGSITMTDRTTGRMWLSHGCIGTKIWSDANTYCSGLNYAGYTDWRLPNKDTLVTIYGQMTVFSCYNGDYYWSSTSYNSTSAWYVDMGGWPSTGYCPKAELCWVWPVRN